MSVFFFLFFSFFHYFSIDLFLFFIKPRAQIGQPGDTHNPDSKDPCFKILGRDKARLHIALKPDQPVMVVPPWNTTSP